MAFQLGASSSSSSPSIFLWNHDVFLSFRCKDVRHNFIAHLNHALCRSGIKTYIDNNLERGEEISPALFKVIEESQMSIIVLSKNYAESRWCLDKLLKILDCKEGMQQILLPIFYHVDPTEVRHQKGIFGESFNKLGDKLKDNAKMEKWKDALETVANLSGFPLVCFRDDESEFIQKIIMWVNQKIVKRMPLSVAKHPIGIESRIRDIYQRLSIERNDIIRVVGIFGTGGIGKTTIANDIYNQISSQFEGSCFLRNIRETSKQRGGLIQLQNTLLSEILGTKLDINDVHRGVNVIRDRLQSKKILLIFDDVDKMVQLEKLVGDLAWFGSGSRVIITTRDQHLLDNSKVDSKYKVRALDDTEALQLFSLYAFEEKEPLKDYVDLSKQVTNYVQGLPLALTVLGSDLNGRNIDQWKYALDKYRKIPHRNIQSVRQISYDSLEDNEKDMFLDIAFFFKGEPLAKIMEIFDSCGFYPVHGIQRLMEKCLITIERRSDECVFMHDLLQDMGREIERVKSSKDPSKRSRLWFHNDVREVLEEDTEPNKIEGIVIDLPEGDEEISLHPEAFRHMKRLRVFINHNARFSCAPNYLSDKLRVLDWYNYPSPYLPRDFQGKKLIVFRMHNSIINKELGERFKPKNLTSMAFESCSYLTEIPDLSSTHNLKELLVTYCDNVVKVHDSVGSLEYLSTLSFFACSKLQILPRSLKLRSLSRFDLGCCSSLRDLPEIECKIEALRELKLSGTAVEELPLSIGNIVGLNTLDLSYCKNLMRLTSIKGFVALTDLHLANCHKLEEIAELPPNLVQLDVSGCKSLERFSEVSKILEFNGSHIRSLKYIDMRDCHKMHENIWNDKVENPLLWKGLYDYDAALFPENHEIPNWFKYVHEFLDNEMEKGPDDDARWRGTEERDDYARRWGTGEEWAIDIKGPHHLEDISGIVLYVVHFITNAGGQYRIPHDVKINSKGSNHVCGVEGVQLIFRGCSNERRIEYNIWVGYSNLQSFEQEVLDNLQVQFCVGPLRHVVTMPFYTSCRAKVVYKNETRANRKRKMGEANVPNSPQQLLA